jgi:glycosyltransferase involved in cell wall biosynthesis
VPTHGGLAARNLTRWATSRATRTTVVSEELGERLRRTGWSRPATVLVNGVDLDLFRPAAREEERALWRARLGVRPGEFLVGSLARFVPGKHQEDLLAATRELRGEGLPVLAVFAGDGPLLRSFQGSAEGCDFVRLTGAIADVPGWMRALDAFVLCSDHEAHPRALLEALASGIPAVVTDVGGIPGIVFEEDRRPAALVVPARDPRQIAGALRTLVTDPTTRNRLALRARERAGDFSADAQWLGYLDLWIDALTRTRGGSSGASGSGSASRSGSSGS